MPIAKALSVLVVDDQDSMRRLTRFALAQLGIENVTDAADGSQAMQVMTTRPFDLILCDWNMKGMDGMTFFKHLKAHPVLKRTPFIMVTGNANMASVEEAMKAGIKYYIAKPFTTAALKARIEAALGGKLERENRNAQASVWMKPSGS